MKFDPRSTKMALQRVGIHCIGPHFKFSGNQRTTYLHPLYRQGHARVHLFAFPKTRRTAYDQAIQKQVLQNTAKEDKDIIPGRGLTVGKPDGKGRLTIVDDT